MVFISKWLLNYLANLNNVNTVAILWNDAEQLVQNNLH